MCAVLELIASQLKATHIRKHSSSTTAARATLAMQNRRHRAWTPKNRVTERARGLADQRGRFLFALQILASRFVVKGRALGKEVVVHTHFNNPNEISWITELAMQHLFERAITVRNQTVLIRGVNDDPHVMQLLVRRLGYLNVHPYYVYMHDLVKGVEDLRTSVQTAVDVEKYVRGSTAGFNTPTFVCDAPGGGGKRDVHSFDIYDRENGIVVYSAPSVKPGRHFLYFDPIDTLDADAQLRWQSPKIAEQMVADAVIAAGGSRAYVPA